MGPWDPPGVQRSLSHIICDIRHTPPWKGTPKARLSRRRHMELRRKKAEEYSFQPITSTCKLLKKT